MVKRAAVMCINSECSKGAECGRLHFESFDVAHQKNKEILTRILLLRRLYPGCRGGIRIW